MNPYILDEVNRIYDAAKKNKVLPQASNLCEYTICGNDCGLMYYITAFMALNENVKSPYTINVVCDGFPKNNVLFDEICNEYSGKFLKQNPSFDYSSIIHVYSDFNVYLKATHDKKNTFLYIGNCDSEKFSEEAERKSAIKLLVAALEAAQKENSNFLFTNILPAFKNFKRNTGAIAEREYEAYVADYPPDSTEAFPIQLENICREYIDKIQKLNVLRLANVFGPGIEDSSLMKINAYAEEIRLTNKVTVRKNTYYKKFSACYICYAVTAMLLVVKKQINGNIYNAAQYRISDYNVALNSALSMLDDGVDMETDNRVDDSCVEMENQSFVAKKITNLGWKPVSNLKEQIYKTILSANNYEYSSKRKEDEKYGYKLDLIKSLELKVIDEIDRICKKYDIKYFLVGGSLLGAVRHNGFIPWDDDLDIGMLRDDFEKFRKVCPKELGESYSYQSYTDEPQSHYIFDKIRLKDTYFTTAFSNRFTMENGIFIDILVYDKTANSEKGQKRHIRTLNIWKRAINVRWVNKPRKNIHYKATVIALPIMRLVPFSWYHKLYEHKLRKYNKNPNNKYMIDGVGMNLNKGAFPAEWFDETVIVPFEDRQLPIPAKYDEYLRHWYGDKYMELLPISSRNSGHNLARIDLGYLVNEDADKSRIHKIDFRGELFEKTE